MLQTFSHFIRGAKAYKKGEKVPSSTIFKEHIIKENTDVAYNKGKKLTWNSLDARAFGYIPKISTEKMFVTNKYVKAHYEIPGLYPDIIPASLKITRRDFKYPGRIWLKGKIITFWIYPKKNMLKKIITDLEKELFEKNKEKINIWNDSQFKIEVLVKNGNVDDNYMWVDMGDEDSENTIERGYVLRNIPLKSYEGSENRTITIGQQHTVSPMQKTPIIPKNIVVPKIPQGMSRAQFNFITTKESCNKNKKRNKK